MKLSIVSTLYQSADSVTEFCLRASAAAHQLVGEDYEIVLVNDGSPDRSLETAVDLCRQNPRLVVLDLSRNFGHHKAMMTGLAHAGGEQIFLMDSDLEEEPEWLINFSQQLNRQGCDVIYGVQKTRKGLWFERWTGGTFYRLFRWLTGLQLPDNIVVARLMTRRYVDALLLHEEREIFMAGLWLSTGYDQRAEFVVKGSRGRTTYTLRRKLAQFVDSVTSFSNAPLIGIFYVGLGISVLAMGFTASLLFNKFFLARPLTGWTSVMASIWLLGGFIISFIGVVGIYLSKVFMETKRRPNAIVRKIYGARS